MNAQTEELQLYFARIKPIYRELFAMAHAICGSFETAEYALQQAIQAGWGEQSKRRPRAGFRERMRELLCDTAVREAVKQSGEAEPTWNGFESPAADLDMDEAAEDAYDPAERAVFEEIAAEALPARRLLLLHYGCGLTPKQSARVTNASVQRVQEELDRFTARVKHRLPARQRRHFETIMERLARDELLRTDAAIPEPGSVYRRFEAEVAEGGRVSHRWLSRAVNAVIVLLLAAVCAGLFWLVAVLMQPPEAVPAPEAPGIEQNI